MALTISAIAEEASELFKESGLHGMLVTEAVVEVCFKKEFKAWKYLLHKSGNPGLKAELSAEYEKLHGFLPPGKSLDKLLLEVTGSKRLYSALLAKLFDAATFKPGEIALFATRKDALGVEIVDDNLEHKSEKAGNASIWDQRIALPAKYRKRFMYAYHEESLFEDLSIYTEEFSEDESTVEKKNVSFKEIPEQHKVPLYEENLLKDYEKLKKMDEARKELNEKIQRDKKVCDQARLKREAEDSLETVATKMCKFQEVPTLDAVTKCWKKFAEFYDSVKNKSVSVSEPEDIILEQHTAETKCQDQRVDPVISSNVKETETMDSESAKLDEQIRAAGTKNSIEMPVVSEIPTLPKDDKKNREEHIEVMKIQGKPAIPTSSSFDKESTSVNLDLAILNEIINECRPHAKDDAQNVSGREEPVNTVESKEFHGMSMQETPVSLDVGGNTVQERLNEAGDSSITDFQLETRESQQEIEKSPHDNDDAIESGLNIRVADNDNEKQIAPFEPNADLSENLSELEDAEEKDGSDDENDAFVDNDEEGTDDTEANYSDNAFASASQYSSNTE